jgi:hypothetical protein
MIPNWPELSDWSTPISFRQNCQTFVTRTANSFFIVIVILMTSRRKDVLTEREDCNAQTFGDGHPDARR